MAEGNGTVAFIAGALIAYLLVSPDSAIQDKTVYYEYCTDFEHNAYSCPVHTDVMKSDYKIFLERQIVVDKFGYTHKSCSVFDKDNWECDKGQSKTIKVQNGNFFETNEGSIDEKGQKSSLPRYSQIPAFFYYVHSTIGFFRQFF